MKKMITMCMAFIIAITSAVTALAEQNPSNLISGIYEYKYTLAGDISLELCRDQSLNGTVEIPAFIDGKPVKEIGSSAFYRMKNMKNVIIPDTVTRIGHGAFNECEVLEKVVIPDNVKTIDAGAFEGCKALVEIVLPDDVAIFGDAFKRTGAYNDPSNWTKGKVGFDGGILYIDNWIIDSGYIKDENLVIEEGTRGIANFAFRGNGIKAVKIPDSITRISESAFSGNKKLTKVELGKNVSSIGKLAFYDCKELKEIVLPQSVKEIGERAFEGCENLENIIMQGGIEAIETGAFEDTKYYNNPSNWEGNALYLNNWLIGIKPESTKCIIKDGTVGIANSLFDRYLLELEIPSTVKYIGRDVGMPKNAKIVYKGTENEFQNIVTSDVWELYTVQFETAGEYGTNDNIAVMLNGANVAFDQPPILENGRTLVPLRAIFEALGADVQWEDSTQTVTANKDGVQISLQIGSVEMDVNGAVKVLDVPAKLLNSRTLVPVRAISEAFGCKVDWEDGTQTVIITQ